MLSAFYGVTGVWLAAFRTLDPTLPTRLVPPASAQTASSSAAKLQKQGT